jgi:hypothetical protein
MRRDLHPTLTVLAISLKLKILIMAITINDYAKLNLKGGGARMIRLPPLNTALSNSHSRNKNHGVWS